MNTFIDLIMNMNTVARIIALIATGLMLVCFWGNTGARICLIVSVVAGIFGLAIHVFTR